MFKRLFLVLALTAFASAASAQIATFDEGSLYDLDPPAMQSTANRILEQMLNNDDMQPIVELSRNDIIRKLSTPVGRLTLTLQANNSRPRKPISYCTASLITKDLILTNFHCVPGQGNIEKALLTMGYLKARNRRGAAQYPVSIKPVEASKELDYAILKVEGDPGSEWGTIELSTHVPESLNTLFVIHHPGGFPKYVTRGRCQTHDPAIDGDDILHKCDTLPGSSGAPIFDNNTRKVIGLHYSAVALKKLNAAKRIASIAKRSDRISELVRFDVPDPVPQKSSQPDKDSEELVALRKRLAALEEKLKNSARRAQIADETPEQQLARLRREWNRTNYAPQESKGTSSSLAEQAKQMEQVKNLGFSVKTGRSIQDYGKKRHTSPSLLACASACSSTNWETPYGTRDCEAFNYQSSNGLCEFYDYFSDTYNTTEARIDGIMAWKSN